MRHIWIGRFFVFFALLLITAPANAQVMNLEQRGAAVVGVDADAEVVWAIPHHFNKDEDDGFERLSFEPIIDAGHGYYAIKSDLIAVDLETGQVAERRRFPGVIAGMVADGGAYRLSLLARADEPDLVVEVSYQPGDAAPGAGLFEPGLALNAQRDALAVARDHKKVELEEMSAEQIERAIERLGEAQRRDPTNLFLPLRRARLLLRQDKASRADVAFKQVAQVAQTHWSDDILAAGLLAEYNQDTLSTQLFERGYQKMLARGVRPDRLHGLVLQVVLTGGFAKAIEQAFAQENLDRAERLMSRIAALFPKAEGSAIAWQEMADRLRAQGRTDQAATWQMRAEEARNSPVPRLGASLTRELDLSIAFLVALSLALILLPFSIGARPAGPRSFRGVSLPDVGVGDIIGIFALVAMSWALPQVAIDRVQAIDSVATAPMELYDQAYASPKFIEWIESRGYSEGHIAWLSYAQKAQNALRAGEVFEEEPPQERLLADMIFAGPANPASTVDTQRSFDSLLGDNPIETIDSIGAKFLYLFAPILAFLAGMLVRRYLAPLARFLQYFIPGSARVLGPLGAPVCAVFIAASLSLLFNLDRLMAQIATPNFGPFFGFSELSTAIPTHTWAWVALGVTIAIHVAAIVWQGRSTHSLS